MRTDIELGVSRQVWRVKYTLAKIRTAARELLTLEEKDPRRLFEGNALLRRLVRIGVLDEGKMKLDYVLGLKVEDFLERRLQTQVWGVLVVLGKTFLFLGFQARAGQVHSSRPSSDQAEAHQGEETGGQHPLLHRQARLSEAH